MSNSCFITPPPNRNLELLGLDLTLLFSLLMLILIVEDTYVDRFFDTCSYTVVIRVVFPLDIEIFNTTDINTSTGCIIIIIQTTIFAVARITDRRITRIMVSIDRIVLIFNATNSVNDWKLFIAGFINFLCRASTNITAAVIMKYL